MRYLLFSALSGVAWGFIAFVLGYAWFPGIIWGGVIVSPFIGLLMGLASFRIVRLSLSLRVVSVLVTLYLAASLFGLAVGIHDALTVNIPNTILYAVVLQDLLAVLWGITFTGYVVVLWPLAYLNHWLLEHVRNQSSSSDS